MTADPAPKDTALLEGPAEVIALYQRIATATLFEPPNAWRIRGLHQRHWLDWKSEGDVCGVIDLPDGRIIGYRVHPRADATRWCLCTVRASRPKPRAKGEIKLKRSRYDDGKPSRPLAQLVELGDSLTAILDAALDAGGAIDERGVIAPPPANAAR